MKQQFKHSINYIAVLIAISSFVLGTICLLLFKTSSDSGFFAIGYFFTLLAAAVNVLMLLLVVINGIWRLKDYKEHLIVVFLVLLNIPIVCFYQELL